MTLRRTRTAASLLVALAATAGGVVPCATAAPQVAGLELEQTDGVGVEQKLGAELPLGTPFQSDEGAFVTLGDSFDELPVLLTLNYVDCPLLCSLQLSNLVGTMGEMELELGVDYRVVTISIHPGDTLEALHGQRERYVTEYRGVLQDAGRDVAADVALAGWTFLRGTRADIDAVAEAVGFGYRWLPEEGEYSHPAPTIVCSPDGVVTRYMQDLGGNAEDLRLWLVEASDGKIGSLLDAVFLTCFKYNPESGNYELAFGLLRGAAALTILAVITGLFFMRRSEPQEGASGAPADTADGEGQNP